MKKQFTSFTKNLVSNWNLDKTILAAFSVLFFIILVFFKYNDPIDTGQTINSSKWGDFATCIAAIATSLTLFYLVRQIIEMRKAASHPDVHPSTINLIAVENSQLPEFRLQSDDNPYGILNPKIILYNIGLGAAKDVYTKWHYDPNEVKKYVDGKYPEIMSLEPEKRIDFIPADKNDSIDLPNSSYMVCCGVRCNQDVDIFFNTTFGNQEEKPKPSLKLFVKYKDIFNKLHCKNFDVSIKNWGNDVEMSFTSMLAK